MNALPGPPWRALSADAAFLGALSSGNFTGRVHSVFTRVVNIEAADGALWTLAAAGCDDAPNTLRVGLDDFGAAAIAGGEPCAGSGEELRIGGVHRIACRAVRVWDERLPAYPDDRSTLVRHLDRVDDWLAEAARAAAGHDESALMRAAAALLHRQADELCSALVRDDLGGARTAARGLIGLGPGLTPAGDDFLTGFLAVLNLERGPARRYRRLGALVAVDAARLTNAISLAALRTAADGRVRAVVIAFLRAMLAGGEDELRAALARVLAIGSSSGRDIVAGIVAGFRLGLALAR